MTAEIEYKYKTLRLAVHAMREKQKTYFRIGANAALRESKELEKRVDDMLAQEP